MNRSEGLFRRVKVRDVEAKNADGSVSNNNEQNKSENDEELEDCDSKETRLTLMEEVLLLGLKDKEVRAVSWRAEFIFTLKKSALSEWDLGLLLFFKTFHEPRKNLHRVEVLQVCYA